MKKTFAVRTATVLAAAVLAVSCGNAQRQQVVAESRRQRDSLTTVIGAKDSLINAVFADINAISENLALIKSRENLITVAGESEGGRRPVEEIDNDIKAIDRLLRENRAKIESLQRSAAQLRKANLRIDGLEKMIADMNRQLAEKKAEVEQLRESFSEEQLDFFKHRASMNKALDLLWDNAKVTDEDADAKPEAKAGDDEAAAPAEA